MNRGPVAEIDLAALRHNLSVVRNLVHPRPVIAVVKADAYGHGAVEISRTLVASGVSLLAVAFTGEARALRTGGITAPILVLFDRSDSEDYFDLDLIPVLSDATAAASLSREACRRGKALPVHVKVDTGMGRLGLRPGEAVDEVVRIADMEGLRLEGMMSHFSEADLGDRSSALGQIDEFTRIRAAIAEKLGRPVLGHMANSAAVLSLGSALFDAVRPGILLYGCSPVAGDFGLRPVMRMGTRILCLRRLPGGCAISYGRTFVTKRESRIAVIPLGYADGYSRLFSNNAQVLVRGKRVPVVGRVCMDLTMIDVTEVDGVAEGDEVVILGSQGREAVSAEELASRINTIPYEIVTSLGSRARKEYRTGDSFAAAGSV